MADANQGWTLEQAIAIAPKLERFNLGWVEEPLRADRPWADWEALAKKT
jgi:L-alanine-DL-glutamate epimerase-like enolase superfamily enzyme